MAESDLDAIGERLGRLRGYVDGLEANVVVLLGRRMRPVEWERFADDLEGVLLDVRDLDDTVRALARRGPPAGADIEVIDNTVSPR